MGSPPVGDTLRWSFYSPSWQLLLEVAADSTAPATATRREQQVWGLRGPDDALLHRIDANANGSYAAIRDIGDAAFYQLTDSAFITSPRCRLRRRRVGTPCHSIHTRPKPISRSSVKKSSGQPHTPPLSFASLGVDPTEPPRCRRALWQRVCRCVRSVWIG
jgi:hypothetical protein